MTEKILSKNCLKCGIEIESRRKFCSVGCSNSYTKSINYISKCVVCKKPFKSHRCQNRKFCSQKCMGLSYSKPSSDSFAICSICGDEYLLPKYYEKKFCSRKCQSKSPAFQSETFKNKIGEASKKSWLGRPAEKIREMAEKQNTTKMRKYGRGNNTNRSNAYSFAKGGKREDLGIYFRSAWEANVARYLNFLVEKKQILKWEYEPKTFIFEGIKKGTLSYTPDFKVYSSAENYVWWEVKGYMDATSKTRLKRMAKFYPDETVIIIDAAQYKSIAQWKRIIPNWE